VHLTLPVHYVRLIADQVRVMGGDVGRWLAESGLSEEDIGATSLPMAGETFERLVAGAIEATGEPALGLFVGERLVATTHGILGYAVLSSGTLRQAIDVFERYTRLRSSFVAIAFDAKGGARVRFTEPHPLGGARRPVLEAVVLSLKNLLEALSGGTYEVRSAAFSFAAPDYAALAREMFRCDVAYDAAWTGLVVPVQGLDAPLKMADPEAFRASAELCQRELEKLVADETFATRVQRLLLEKQSRFPSLNMVARRLHVTPRTLHRRLLDEGTSYRELLETIRHRLALEHVKANRSSMEEIAYLLGYADLASFRRAFKRWERTAPSAYRAALARR